MATRKPRTKRSTRPKKPGTSLTPPKVEQPHGGAIYQGGVPGNKGGTGRPPETIRMESRALFEKWMTWANKKLDDANSGGKEIAKDEVLNLIGSTAGKYGFPNQDMISRQTVREILQKQIDVTLATLNADDAERLLAAIHPLWFPA